MYVAAGRSCAALDGYCEAVGEAGCGRSQTVAMDMWPTSEQLDGFRDRHLANGRDGLPAGARCWPRRCVPTRRVS